jgi:hypothetical protein
MESPGKEVVAEATVSGTLCRDQRDGEGDRAAASVGKALAPGSIGARVRRTPGINTNQVEHLEQRS